MQKQGRKIIKTFAILLLMVVVAFILYFAAHQRHFAYEHGGRILELISGAVHGTTRGLDPERTDVLDIGMRICMHMGEYMLLGIAVGLVFSAFGIRRQLRFIYGVMIGSAFAVVDEVIQALSPSRDGDIKDIMCDVAGTVIAAAFIFMFRSRKFYTPSSKVQSSGRRSFMRVMLDDVTFAQALDRIMEMAAEGRHYIVTANVDHMIKLEKDEEFKEVYDHADLAVCDGTPLRWIGASFGCPVKERVTGADLFPAVCRRAGQEGRSVFLLGGREGVAEKAAAAMREKYEGLNVAGTCSPPFHFEKDPKEMKKIIKLINSVKPDILMVCVGSPKSEKLIYKYINRLNVHVALPFGAAIDFAAGEVKRAPEWMRKWGLEWFFRFLQEPGRLFKRYFIEDMKIFLLALKYKQDMIRGYAYEDSDGPDESE